MAGTKEGKGQKPKAGSNTIFIRLKAGGHSQDGRTYGVGEVFESDQDLVAEDPRKYEYHNGPATDKPKVLGPYPKIQDVPFDRRPPEPDGLPPGGSAILNHTPASSVGAEKLAEQFEERAKALREAAAALGKAEKARSKASKAQTGDGDEDDGEEAGSETTTEDEGEEAEDDGLESENLSSLKETAKAEGVIGFSSMSKDKLVEAIRTKRGEAADTE